jgi:hypothetical protein
MSRLDLSQSHIDCHIVHSGAIPSGAFVIIGTLAEAVETANAELAEYFEVEETDEPDE